MLLVLLAGLLTPALDAAWELAEAAALAATEPARREADAALAAVQADAEAAVAARAAYKRGWLSLRFGRAAEATGHFAESLRLDAGGRFAARARRHLQVLGERAAEDAALLARLGALARRHAPATAAADREAVLALLAEARTDEGRSRTLAWLGEEALRRGALPEARARFFAVLALEAPPPAAREHAALGLIAAADDRAALAEVQAAFEDVLRRHPGDTGFARLLDEVEDRRLRAVAEPASVAALLALLALFGGQRGWRAFRPATLRIWRPWRGAGFIVYAFAGGGLLAEQWNHGWFASFAASGAAVAAVHVLAGAVRQTQPAPVLRAATALVAVAATFGACFVVLTLFGTQEVMGL